MTVVNFPGGKRADEKKRKGVPDEKDEHERHDVTLDELRKLATKWKRRRWEHTKKMALVLRQVLNGESFAVKGERDEVIFRLGVLLAEELPSAKPESISRHFATSLKVMDGEAEECPTVEDVTEKISRRQEELREQSKKNKQEPPADGKRQIIVLTPELHDVVERTIAQLAKHPDVFQREAQLVRLVRVAEVEAKRERMAPGTPQIRTIELPTLRVCLTQVARFFKLTKGKNGDEKWIQKVPPDNVVSGVNSHQQWPRVRPVVGIIETPSLRRDGTVIDTPGYDPLTGYIYAPSREYPAIPEEPRKEDARRAFEDLLEPWQDFACALPEGHLVPLAAVLTLIGRPAIRGACPAFLSNKTVAGTGGTLMMSAIGMIAQAREAAVMTWRSNDDDEIEKILGAYAMRGASLIAWDNIEGEFGGAPLNKYLTCADRVDARLLGKSKVPTLPWRGVMIGNGNNFVTSRDTSRRVLVCQMESELEHPEDRTGFALGEGDEFIEWCREHHPRLVVAAITLLRAYLLARDRDPSCAPQLGGWGSFGAWRDLIAGAIFWVSGLDVMETRPVRTGDEDEGTEALRVIIDQWRTFAPDGISASDAVAQLYDYSSIADTTWGTLRQAVGTIAPPERGQARPKAETLGKALARFRRRVMGTSRRSRLDYRKVKGTRIWFVEDVKK